MEAREKMGERRTKGGEGREERGRREKGERQ